MSEITEGYYCFLCNIGVPYGGYVKGHGKACSLPIPAYSPRPINGSIGGGKTYVSHNYVSTIIPEDTQSTSSDAELEKIMKDYLLRRGIYDKNSPNEPIKIKNPAYLQIKVHGDSTTVIYNLPPHNINEKSRTSDLLGAMQYAESGGAGYQGGSVVLTNANNRELPIRTQSQSQPSGTLNAARKIRTVSSFALTVNDWIKPAVETMKNSPSSIGKSPLWFQKNLIGSLKIDSRSFINLTVKSQVLKSAPTVLRSLGYTLGGIGIGTTIIDVYLNGLNRNNGTHLVMGVVALIPQTRVISMAYFMTNMIVNLNTEKNIEDYYIGYEEGVKKAFENNSVSGHWTTNNPYSPYQAY